MKKEIIVALIAISMMLVTTTAVLGGKPTCTTIQSGEIMYSVGHYLYGESLIVRYDIFGYNYQAHIFNGYYCNIYLGRAGLPPYAGDADSYLTENPTAESHWAWPYRDTLVQMKWNDAWLSNKDCDDDGKLDRHNGFPSYIGSGAWLTNHMWGINEDGTYWNYFVKIVAAPADATVIDGIWYTADNTEIGPVIWGAFAIIQQVSNDPLLDEHGLQYNAPAPTGFGYY